MRLVMTAEPAPLPSLLHVLPPSSVPHKPARATPAMTMSEHGFAETRPRLPHSEVMPARLPVAFAQAAGDAVTVGIGLLHWNESGLPGAAPPLDVEPPAFAPAPPEAPPADSPPLATSAPPLPSPPPLATGA